MVVMLYQQHWFGKKLNWRFFKKFWRASILLFVFLA